LPQHRHWPPHLPREEWANDEGHPPWPGPWRRQRRFLFFRLAGIFGFMALLILGGMAAMAFLLTRLFGGNGQTAVLVWLGGCSLALALPLLAASLARGAWRGIATPLVDVMAAADALAEGNLSVRVPERGPGDFSRLAHSFNRMAQELERAEHQRRNLTADVAHELRTPLHIIQGNLEGILDGVYQPSAEHLNATLEETRLLARLVDDLGTLSLAEAGQLPLQWEPVDIAELLADTSTTFTGQAEAAGIHLNVTADDASIKDGGPPLLITADAGRLDQVLTNLLVNALRHTPRGGTITLSAAPTTSGVRLIISDTGAGISPEDLPYIFDRFWRGDRSRSHTGGAGAGLGLAIARQLVQAHGGRITVASQPGQGTTFTIELPQDRAKA
jgi:two-component system OmpR family sensor kinase/two-component system sensor histidine kinase BaeS